MVRVVMISVGIVRHGLPRLWPCMGMVTDAMWSCSVAMDYGHIMLMDMFMVMAMIMVMVADVVVVLLCVYMV